MLLATLLGIIVIDVKWQLEIRGPGVCHLKREVWKCLHDPVTSEEGRIDIQTSLESSSSKPISSGTDVALGRGYTDVD